MTEILTESFCERCGTRYTFESARPKSRLKGVKVMTRGLKNFVLSDDTSMDEAMAAARSETERESTAYQLDAFHKTFNFCMQCRQYTCPNCWNEAEARCLTCAPHLGHEIMPAPFPDLPEPAVYLAEPTATEPVNGQNGSNGWHPINGAEPDTEPGFDFAARLAALTALPTPEPTAVVAPEPPAPAPLEETVVEPEPDAVVAEPVAEPPVMAEAPAALEPVAEAPVVAEPVADGAPVVAPTVVPPVPVAADPTREPVADVAAAAEPVAASPDDPGAIDDGVRDAAGRLAAFGAAAVVMETTPEPAAADRSIDDKMASQTTGLLKRFRPGESLDAEIASYEAGQEAPTVEAVEALVAAEAVSSAAAPTEPDPEPAAVAPPAEPVVPEPAPVPPVEATPEPAPALPAAADVVSQPTWQMVAPDPTTETPLVEPPATMPAAASAADPAAEPQWPERPQWLGGGAANGLPFLNRPAAPQGGIEALWAQSNAEVASRNGTAAKPAGGTQPCISCGLSLSATARFCRRCGTPQAD